MKIITLTMNPAVDKSSSVDRVVAEWKLRCDIPSYEPGGGGINVSRAIRKLGGDSLALYTAGGLSGGMLFDLLKQEGLDQQKIEISGPTRESLSVLEKTTGLQYRFNMPGPMILEREWQDCLSKVSLLIPECEYLVASGGLPPGVPPDFYARLAKMAKDQGIRLVLDTSGEALRLALKEGVFLIKPNLREFSELTGQEMKDEAEEEKRARALVASGGSEVVVVSLGAAGVLAAITSGAERVAAPVVPIKSKVGAGDSTVAGMVLALARGLSWPEALRFGVAAGASAVMTPGTELCRREDTERLYKQMLERRP